MGMSVGVEGRKEGTYTPVCRFALYDVVYHTVELWPKHNATERSLARPEIRIEQHSARYPPKKQNN